MKTGLILSIITALALLSAHGTCLADTSIKAEVGKTSITTDETLTYKLTITSDEKKLPQPELPDFANFSVVYSAQSSTLSVAKNSTRTTVSYSYILAPLEAGKFTVGPGRVKAGDKTYSSQAFEIEVKQGVNQPQPPHKQEPPQPEEEIPESKEPQFTI